jgi:hypothetical protein
MSAPAPTREDFEDLLGSISLYLNWRYVTKQLTTPQKEMFADAADAWAERLLAAEDEPAGRVERWWRDDSERSQ